MTKCAKYLVSGRVQGVYFRASTRQQAQRLGLTGWAKNLPDGRVEVLACGSPEALNRLHDWLWQGPSLALVDQVDRQEVEVEVPSSFRTR